MPIDNLSKITSRSGINTTILLEAGNANVTGIVTAAGFDGPFTGGSGSDINAGIVTARDGLHVGAGGTIIHALSSNDGNIGINKTSDIYEKLTILDANQFQNSRSGGLLLQCSGTSGADIGVPIAWRGHIGDGTEGETYGLASICGRKENATYSFDATSAKGYLQFNTTNNSASEKMRITSDGKVGIGSTDPGAALEVNGGTSYDVAIFNTEHADGPLIPIQKAGSNIGFLGSGKNCAPATGVATDLALRSQNELIFTAGGGVERLRIKATTGDLLLGAHGSRIFDDSSGTNVVVDIYGGTTAGKRGILALGGRTGSDDADIGTIQFVNENNNLATAANHVQSKLVASIDVKSETTDGNAGSDSGGHLLFSTKPETGSIDERLRITSDGKVGINSTSPTNTLVVREPTDNNSSLQLFRASTGGDISSIIWATNQGNQASINYRGGGGSTGMQFYTGGTGSSNLRAIIDTSGNVGVNTNFTGSQLWRNGQKIEIFGGSGNVTGELHLGANRGDGQQSVGSINFFDNTQDSTHRHIAIIEADKSGSTSNKRGGDLLFYTKTDNVAAPTEKVRIKADGRLGLGVDTATAGDLASGDSQNHPLFHVKGTTVTSSNTGGEYNLLGRFEAGGDANSTGAMIVLNHSNDRGIALIGGREIENRAFGAIKAIDNQGRLSDGIIIEGGNGAGIGTMKFFTGESTTTTERLRIDSSGRVGINTTTHPDTSSALSIMNGATGSDHCILDIRCNDNETSRIYFSEVSTSGKGSIRYRYTGDDNYMSFYTDGTASSNERLRITKDGELIMTNAATTTFFDASTTSSGANTRGLISLSGKKADNTVVTLKMGGFGDTDRGEIYTHSNHALGFATNNAAAQMILTTNGHLQLVSGNLEFANGSGIDFSNVPDGSRSIDSDGNKLDDYEEGSFTPYYYTQDSLLTAGYVTQHGKYTKIGRFVHFQIYLRLSSKSGGSGHLRIYGLPFTASSASGAAYGGGVVAYTNNWDNTDIDRIMIGSGSDQVQLFVGTSSGTNVNAGAGNLNSDTQLRIFGSYQV